MHSSAQEACRLTYKLASVLATAQAEGAEVAAARAPDQVHFLQVYVRSTHGEAEMPVPKHRLLHVIARTGRSEAKYSLPQLL